MRKQRHSDDDVKFWAKVFTELDITLEEIESELKNTTQHYILVFYSQITTH